MLRMIVLVADMAALYWIGKGFGVWAMLAAAVLSAPVLVVLDAMLQHESDQVGAHGAEQVHGRAE